MPRRPTAPQRQISRFTSADLQLTLFAYLIIAREKVRILRIFGLALLAAAAAYDEAERALRECERELADLGIKLGEDGMLHAEGAQQRTQPHGGAAADGMGHAGYAPVADPRYNPRVQGVR